MRKEVMAAPIFGNGAGKGSTPVTLTFARIQGNGVPFVRECPSRLRSLDIIIVTPTSTTRKRKPPMTEPIIMAVMGLLCESTGVLGAAEWVEELLNVFSRKFTWWL